MAVLLSLVSTTLPESPTDCVEDTDRHLLTIQQTVVKLERVQTANGEHQTLK